MDTLRQIQQLSTERHNLYRRAGQQTLTPTEINRIHAITAELYDLWDTHRRDVAAPHTQQPMKANNIIDFRKVA